MAKGSIKRFLVHVHPRYVPAVSSRFFFTWCLGGLALWLFILETVSGLLLMLHYVPSTPGAYASVQDLTHIVPYGFLLRNFHYWGGQAMVVLVVLHMTRVILTRSYAFPRTLNWLVGIALLVSTVLVDFTGYLLVWDDRGLWARTIARNLAKTVPVVGRLAASLLFGPEEIGDPALIRLYAWHILFLPGLISVLAAWHFWRIRADGGISTPL